MGSAKEISCDVLVVGGGLGGVAAALTAAKLGATTVLCEELDWLGGQVTAQGVPLDEHPWNETVMISRTLWDYRHRVRDYYLRNLPLTAEARSSFPLNPGAGYVSSLCHDPRVSVRVLDDMLAPYEFGGRLTVLRRMRLTDAIIDGDVVRGAVFLDLEDDRTTSITAKRVIDATESGDLIELAGIEHVIGAEARADTGEPSALEVEDPMDQAGTTVCCALDYLPKEDHTIERPATYDFWNAQKQVGSDEPLFSFVSSDHFTHERKAKPLFAGDSDAVHLRDQWHFRRVAYRRYFEPGVFESDITIACWAMHEYHLNPLLGIPKDEVAARVEQARQQTLSMVYWLQTEAPRHDGGTGYRGLRLRGDVLGTRDGLAKQPYNREGRRIEAEFRLLEQHIGVDARHGLPSAEFFSDSVGIGAYRINIHPTTRGRDSVDIPTYPYQIPLGALLPVRAENITAGCCKTIGSTRLTSSSLRHHPIDWVVGEAAGALSAYSIRHQEPLRAVRARPERLRDFQRLLADLGMMLRWPEPLAMTLTYAQAAPFSEIFHETQGAGRFPTAG